MVILTGCPGGTGHFASLAIGSGRFHGVIEVALECPDGHDTQLALRGCPGRACVAGYRDHRSYPGRPVLGHVLVGGVRAATEPGEVHPLRIHVIFRDRVRQELLDLHRGGARGTTGWMTLLVLDLHRT